MNWLGRKIDGFISRVRDDPSTKSILVGPPDRPYYRRYFVIPRNRYFNVYLHYFMRSDEGELHDHRMANITVVLQGWYYDQRFVTPPVAGQPLPETYISLVERMRPVFRRASTPHRVVFEKHDVWSLFIGFPHTRNWGFWRSFGGVACWFPHQCLVLSPDPTGDGYGQNRSAA